jgi:putative transposase
MCGSPQYRIRSENGQEFAVRAVQSQRDETGSGIRHIAPPSLWQNGYADSFHSEFLDEVVDRKEFKVEPQAGALGTPWKEECHMESVARSLVF